MSASAGPIESLLGTLGKGKEFVCRKGKLLDFKFSIRAGNGKACTNRVIAAFAELICKGFEDKDGESTYDNSKCAANAKTALKGESPMKVLATEGKNLGAGAAKLVCAAAGAIPVLSTVCGLLK